ncbi:MAG: polyhydroxyalkanoate synthesis repressor PhaR, partial [Microvirgula sp.]
MSSEKRVIKKYPNRRLYDTATSSYITLEDVKQLVVENVDVQVIDAKSQDDITRSVLLQIILEEESSGAPLFTYDVLTRLIRFYGNAMQGLMGGYLEKNLELFSQMQGKLQDQTRQMMSDSPMTQSKNLWADFMKFQGPAAQNMMTNYLEQ